LFCRCSQRRAPLGSATVTILALGASLSAAVAPGGISAGSARDGPNAHSSPYADSVNPPIVVTREGTDLPAGCSPRQIAAFVVGFFNDFNQDRKTALLRRLAPPRKFRDVGRDARDGRLDFRWYSVDAPGKRHFVAYDRRSFVRYVDRRQLRHERLRLAMIDVAPNWVRYTVAISFALFREADDLPTRDELGADPLAFGKGTINCAPSSLSVWSMSGPPDKFAWMCPLPSGWAPGLAVVACRRA
jgi:hypothetical protein